MKVSRLNIVLAIAMLLVYMLAASSSVDYSQPNVEFLPEMKYSPAYGAFEPNPNFEDGRTLRPPSEGTIARGETPLHLTASKEDAIRAGEVLVNPIDRETEDPEKLKAAQESVRRGSEVYRVYCAACHAASGKGDSAVAKRSMLRPPSLLTGNPVKKKDGQLFHVLTFGQGNMAAMADQLTPAERWDAVNYVRHLQQQAAAHGVAPMEQNADGNVGEEQP